MTHLWYTIWHSLFSVFIYIKNFKAPVVPVLFLPHQYECKKNEFTEMDQMEHAIKVNHNLHAWANFAHTNEQ